MRVRLALFSALTLVLAYGDPTRLRRSVPGDPGDAHLILALLRWGGDRSTHAFSGYWDGPMFSAGRDVMAYTDTFLPLTVPFELLATVAGSEVAAFNLLYLASWVLCGEATFRLARRFVSDDRAALVGAIAFTFATIRLSSVNHFQLAWAGFIPLGFLLFFRFRDRPTPLRGVLLAVVLVAQFLTSAYYGLFLVVGIGVLTAIGLGLDLRASRLRDTVAGHVALGVAMVAMLVPVMHWYGSADECAAERAFDVALTALRPENFLSVPQKSVLLGDAPVIGADTMASSGENHAYVGIVVLVAVAGLGVWVARRRRIPDGLQHPAELAAIGAVGVVVAAVAAGPLAYPFPLPYDLATAVVPGVDAMGVLGRLAVFVQLPLALLTSVAVAAVLRDRTRTVAFGVTALLIGVIALEGLSDHPMFEPVEPRVGSVYDELAGLDDGVAVELPMPPRSTVFPYAFVESTRMWLGSGDDIQTVNGYSGYAPVGYDRTVDDLNAFPMPRAIDRLRSLGVDYLVLHAAMLDTGDDAVTAYVAQSGWGAYDLDELDSRLIAMPFDLVERQIDAADGIVLVLTPGPDVGASVACERDG